MHPFLQPMWARLEAARRVFLRNTSSLSVPRILQFFAWLLSSAARLLVRSFSLLAPCLCFLTIWATILAFYDKHIPASGLPFPRPRTYFVTALATIPIWGLAMIGFALFNAGGTYLWHTFHERGTHNVEYGPISLDIEEVPEVKPSSRRRASGTRKRLASCRPNPVVRWFICISAVVFGVCMLHAYQAPRFKSRVELANRVLKREGYGNGEKVFVAALFFNNEAILPYWIAELTKFINYVGPDNVFISIVESHSGDNTVTILEGLERTLETMNVAHRIIIGESTLQRPAYDKPQPRIPYLAALRNIAMDPLLERGEYTRVIWSNDVFIEAEAMVELLNTRDGDYDYACGMDFGPWGLYDMWVIRDRLGRMASTVYPYLFDVPGYQALMADEPAPVFTCWNGIVAMKADPFIDPARRNNTQLSTAPLARPLTTSHPSYPLPADMAPTSAPPLRFRESAESECFSSECLLLPYDLRRVYGLEKHYVNPRVVNAYEWGYYVWFKWVVRHPVVQWWIKNVEDGRGMFRAQLVLGYPEKIWRWDGVECHPWWGELPVPEHTI